MDAQLFSALNEPNRLRIVELLNSAPRSVGEVAAQLGLRQPQTTKHLQTLQRAGLVTMHPLGQRRIYALRRERFRELLDWLETLAPESPSDRQRSWGVARLRPSAAPERGPSGAIAAQQQQQQQQVQVQVQPC